MAGVDQPTLLVTLTGPDRPGVTSTLFDRISAVGAEVIDLEQVVLRGQLTLAVLLAVDGVEPQLRQVVHETGTGLGMQVQVHSGRGDNRSRPTGRAAVAVLGAPITATHLAAVSKAIAEHGANIIIHANHLLRSAFPAMQKTAELTLQHGRTKEADQLCLSIKEILTLIPTED